MHNQGEEEKEKKQINLTKNLHNFFISFLFFLPLHLLLIFSHRRTRRTDTYSYHVSSLQLQQFHVQEGTFAREAHAPMLMYVSFFEHYSPGVQRVWQTLYAQTRSGIIRVVIDKRNLP